MKEACWIKTVTFGTKSKAVISLMVFVGLHGWLLNDKAINSFFQALLTYSKLHLS